MSCDWLPPWIEELDADVWVTAPGGELVYLNDRARELFGEDHPAACHSTVHAHDQAGELFCRPRCELQAKAARGERIAPIRLRIGAGPEERWICLVAVPLTAPDGSSPWLVHIAHDVSAAHRSEEYLTRVAAGAPSAPNVELTPREREILELLSHNEDAHAIARRLHVSYATVRNHIQRILPKLGVHSMQEAIAWYLLRHVEPTHACPGCESAGGGCGLSFL